MREAAATNVIHGSEDGSRDTAPPTGRSTSAPAASLVRIAVAASLIAGWLEVASTQLPRIYGELVFADADAIWITPLSYAVFLLPWALLLTVGQRLTGRNLRPALMVGLLLFPATLGLVWMLYPWVHRLALLMLAIGLAVQAGRFAAASPGGFDRMVRRTMRFIGALTVIIGVSLHALSFAREQWIVRHLPAPDGTHPNIVLLILDTVRAKSLSLYGHLRATTPRLEHVARRATVFRSAFSVSPWTLPAHASMFTGRYPYELSTDWARPLDEEPRTLAEVLGKAGYRTAGFVGNIEYTSALTGLARGFAHYEDWPLTIGRIVEGSSLATFILNNPRVRALTGRYEAYTGKNGERIANDFLRWADGSRSSQRPFFAFLNFLDAHEPYFVPAPWEERFGTRANRGRGLIYPRHAVAKRPLDAKLSASELADEERAYDGSIAYLDHVVASLMDSLEARGLLDSTLVVISSDHGELFGEFGFARHGNTLYPQALHVPLIMRYPNGVPGGRIVADAVSMRDLPATVLDIVGVRNTEIPGRSLARFWRPDRASASTPGTSPLLSELWAAPNQPTWFPVSRGYMRSVVGWPLMLIARGDGARELIALTTDTALRPPDPSTDSIVRALTDSLDRIPRTRFPGRERSRSTSARGTAPPRS